MIDKEKLIPFLRRHFALDWGGVHGAPHWARVRRFGLYLAEDKVADREVITLFALLHDSCRENEHSDHDHGARAARLAQEMNGLLYRISREQEDMLATAIKRHSGGHISDDPTIQICWDADRLDLGRLGIVTIPEKLGTEKARQLCRRAWPYLDSVRPAR